MKQERITRFIKPEDANQKWYVVDAKDQVLGRLAAQVARVIRGKNKALFTPNMDAGDFVVVINADKIRMTGKRESQKEYFSHSLYPGGGRFRSFSEVMAKNPSWVVENAVRGMLPKTKLGKRIGKKLKVYAGESHPHSAQKPEALSF
ncbi:MAG: 50S ribosomal protein L13 [Melioribacteraceae bacterium]